MFGTKQRTNSTVSSTGFTVVSVLSTKALAPGELAKLSVKGNSLLKKSSVQQVKEIEVKS